MTSQTAATAARSARMKATSIASTGSIAFERAVFDGKSASGDVDGAASAHSTAAPSSAVTALGREAFEVNVIDRQVASA